jgi:pyruvate/2-oxoglutarate dehydrogenase complex dihydrolipoamide dehydrogenase (E3) component
LTSSPRHPAAVQEEQGGQHQRSRRVLKRENEKWQIEITGDNPETIEAQHVIIASGSKPRYLTGITVDNVDVLDNVGALDLKEVPKRLGVIGAGVIGLEMSSVWRRLGAEVTILEAMPHSSAQLTKKWPSWHNVFSLKSWA